MDSNNLTPLRKGVVGVQFLFVAFGATVLVPLLVGLDPSTALFTAGIGTLIFHAENKRFGTLPALSSDVWVPVSCDHADSLEYNGRYR